MVCRLQQRSRSTDLGVTGQIFLKIYVVNFHAHVSCVGKQGKLVWVLSFDR